MDKFNAFLDFIRRTLIVIFSLCALLAIVVFSLSYIAFSDFGPKSDQEIIASIPSKFEVEQVLAKDSDIIDSSCTTIVLKIGETSSKELIEKGHSFFNSQTNISTDVEVWKPLTLLKEEPKWINDDSFLSAVKCSDVNTEFKNLAEKLIKSEVGFYTVSSKRRTIYSVFPYEKKLFITHLD